MMKRSILLLAFGLLFAANLSAQEKVVVVACEHYEVNMNLWDNSNLAFAKQVGTVACGDSVTLVDKEPVTQLVRIRTGDGREAYIPGRAVGFPERPLKTTAKNEKLRGGGEKVCAKNPGWSKESCLLVSQHRVAAGMNFDMVHGSIGTPCHVNTTYLQGGHRQDQLVYISSPADNTCLFQPFGWHGFSGYVYLEDGVVTAVQVEH